MSDANPSEMCSCDPGSTPARSHWSAAVEELVAIGAAIGSNCIPCLRFHIDKARELGLGDDDLVRAVATASQVKQTPARLILDQADRQLGGRVRKEVDTQACCSLAAEPRTKSGCCG